MLKNTSKERLKNTLILNASNQCLTDYPAEILMNIKLNIIYLWKLLQFNAVTKHGDNALTDGFQY